MASLEINPDEFERMLLQVHRVDPKDPFILNELIYHYSLKNETAKADHYEALLRKVVDESVALNSK